MVNRPYFAATLVLTAALSLAPAHAAVIIITQAKAANGGVTPTDAPGFPVTLSLPGAYRLDSNLTVPADKSGIFVKSHYVDIDMAGFRLLGANAANAKVAIHGVFSGYGIGHIHNGIISSFKGDGIRLVTGPSSNAWVVEDMQIVSNDGYGIRAEVSSYSRFSNNLILVNGASGVWCGEYCHVKGNTIADNGSHGVFLYSGTVLGNSIFSNKDYGIFDSGSANDVGYGNNTLSANTSGGDQVFGGVPLQPNACVPGC